MGIDISHQSYRPRKIICSAEWHDSLTDVAWRTWRRNSIDDFVQCAIAARRDDVIVSGADRLPRQILRFACALSHTHLAGIERPKLFQPKIQIGDRSRDWIYNDVRFHSFVTSYAVSLALIIRV